MYTDTINNVEIFAWYAHFFGHSPLYLHIGGAKLLPVRCRTRKLAHHSYVGNIRVTRSFLERSGHFLSLTMRLALESVVL